MLPSGLKTTFHKTKNANLKRILTINKTPHRRFSSSPPGLYSLPHLHNPSDFLSLASSAMDECDSIRASLSSRPPSSLPLETLRELDAVSNSICSVIDAAELCRSTHPDARWRDRSSNAFHLLSQYISDLNSDRGLYEKVVGVTSSPDFRGMDEAERRFGVLLQAEFERDGIHLEKEKREEVMRIQNHITHLETLFSQNIIRNKKNISLPAGEVLDVLHSSMVKPSTDAECGLVQISSEAHITNTLLKYSPSPSLRKDVYMHAHTACPENLEVLESLIKHRQNLAKHLGFPSYAHYFLRDKMAQNPETVQKFLMEMRERIRPAATKEKEMLKTVKRKMEGGDEIYPWDVSFYTSLIKSQMFQLDQNDLSSSFSVQGCIEGMKTLVHKLFDIQIIEKIPASGEIWGEDIQKLNFYFEGELLGTLYLDLFPREHKYVHAAHFTVRCGCRINENEFQTPIVALVCNLSPLSAQQHPDQHVYLSHAEVETLYHEFGHALHSLLSRTEFQHLSGTRSAIDFVETPSHLMEYFVWTPEFLRILSPSLENDVLRKLVESRNAFRALDAQMQILYAVFDQTLFGPPSARGVKSSTELFAELHRRSDIPYAEGTHWHSRFGHLVTYGAGYYGYLYDQVFASDIWKTCFAVDPLGKEAGTLFWKEMLMHGGARDPNEMLRRMLGREPSVDAFFEELR